MKLVVGLGNPGARYAATRHNLGFFVADLLFARSASGPWQKKFSGEFAQIGDAGGRAGLLKPLTFMNGSGRSVQAAASFYKVEPPDIVLVHDELDLPFGTLRLKRGGGEAGHNGLRSVSQALGTRDYLRLRMGVGKPPVEFHGSGADFVLEAFAPAERPLLDGFVERAADAVVFAIGHALEQAMNVINRREKT